MPEETLAADRRVLAIAAAAMVVLVAIGVVSAQLFTASACADIGPEPVDSRPAGSSLEVVLQDALADLGADELGDLRGALSALTAQLGPVVGVADVGAGSRLTQLGGGIAATGAVTTLLDGSLTGVASTVSVGSSATIVGDGDVVWSLALANQLTGQVDAFLPINAGLEAGTCLDTATVGTPLAFLLDAGAGELLLFRVQDDGDAPQVELHGADGRRWVTPIDVATAPPGLAAERLTGAVGGGVVLVGQRVGLDDDGRAVVGLDRSNGTQRWALGVADIADAAPSGEGELWVRAMAVDDDLAVVALSRDGAPARATYVGLDAADGSRRWVAGLDGPRQAAAAELTPQGLVIVVYESGLTVYAVDRDDGDARPRVGAMGDDVALAVAQDGRILVAADDTLTVVSEATKTVDTGVQVADVTTRADGTVVVLLASDDGAAAVAFGGG